ncbi:hypothetical protein [Sinorhizobium medicae]|uniref:hypothetical protein n=1 Tax=Sinorhizobium medicae TaxID=110321 RepID=UPI0013E35C3D|nr:hypothetical protein [Sinorhizobium medicae]WQO50190.1 hypothetical protein U8C42_34270 [Sinorhizobium medicae]WQO70290.1 hypothetical protein U8C40_33280 [Sinorhizobium medicae]WQO77442.1 hypothetical protein U8C31_33595 [Sinorhizobium medicae]WQO96576.1 hypothetical protein U8C32_32565 [Sinorhizobium medicae]
MRMFQITLQKMLILARLAIVVSLTAYSLPAASASMHGGWSNTEIAQSGDHHDETKIGGHSHDDQKSSPDDAKKLVKTECCTGFCVSMAIVAQAGSDRRPRVASIRKFADDARPKGELPPLHRPPSI